MTPSGTKSKKQQPRGMQGGRGCQPAGVARHTDSSLHTHSTSETMWLLHTHIQAQLPALEGRARVCGSLGRPAAGTNSQSGLTEPSQQGASAGSLLDAQGRGNRC